MTATADDGPDAPALNHAGGVARLMGDRLLFAQVLARFRDEYRQAARRIRAALGTGDTPLALRLAHTLKGAAGMIEAVPLRRAAEALERVLRHPSDGQGGGDPWQCLDRLEQALERVLLELDAAPARVPPPDARALAAAEGPEKPEKPDAAGSGDDALRRLAALLADGDGDAVDLVRDAAGALSAQLGEGCYRRLAERVDAFDFDGALALLAAGS